MNGTTSIFGWDFETQLMRNPTGVEPITSLVLGVAGLEQGLVLPAVRRGVVGIRTQKISSWGSGQMRHSPVLRSP